MHRPSAPSVFDNFHRGLVGVHGELREGAAQVEAGALGAAADAEVAASIRGFCQTLLDHHKSEDRFFFPAFRAAGRLRSSDVAFLDARDAEHGDIHRLCLALRDGAGDNRGARWRSAAAQVARDLAALSLPHFAAEEATLTPRHLATLIAPGDLVRVYRDMGENWNRR
jgi:hypothetical protein